MRIDNTTDNETVLREIGRKLASFRRQLKLTQAALAKQAGVSKRTIERMEAGYSIQTITMIRVLRVFNLLSILDEATPRAKTRGPRVLKGKHLPASGQKDSAKTQKSKSWGY